MFMNKCLCYWTVVMAVAGASLGHKQTKFSSGHGAAIVNAAAVTGSV